MTTDQPASPPPAGFIDIHCHLLPGVDDGCASYEESLDCIRLLKQQGFVGSVCTPHIHPKFPDNIPANIHPRVELLREKVREAGIDYHLWTGGEVTARDTTMDWMKEHGVPTLAGSRCVLMDIWAPDWPDWIIPLFAWLIDQRYQPILAHPERFKGCHGQDARLDEIARMGVLLQGNYASFAGKYGPETQDAMRQFFDAGRYSLMATDTHRPSSMEPILQGLSILTAERGQAEVDQWLSHTPRKLLGL